MTRSADWKRLKGKPRGGPQQSKRRQSHAPRSPLTAYEKSIPEAVVKVAAWGKSIRAAGDLAGYIAERSEHVTEREQLIDQDGASHDLDAIRAHLMEAWDLKPDADNLSPAARKLSPDERSALPEHERLQARQVAHMVISWPKDFPIARHQAEATAAAMLEPFTSAGHKSLMVYHSDQGRPHVHVILQVRNPETGRALSIGPRELHLLRERQASLTKEITGRQMQATRREERPDLRQEIVQGRETLRTKSREHRPTLLERQVPAWYSRHGYQYEARRLQWQPRNAPLPPLAVRMPRLAKGEEILDQWAERFSNPETAKDRWREMACEAPRTAFWYANHRPEVFGDLRPGFDPRQITARQIHVSPAWQQEAAAALARAANSPQIEAHRLSTAQTLRAAKADQQKRDTADYMAQLLTDPEPSRTTIRPPASLSDRIPGLRAFARLYERQPGRDSVNEQRPDPKATAPQSVKQTIAELRRSLERLRHEEARLAERHAHYSKRRNWTEFAEQRTKTADRLTVVRSAITDHRERLNALHEPGLLDRLRNLWRSPTQSQETKTPAIAAAPVTEKAPEPAIPDRARTPATEAGLTAAFIARFPALRAFLADQQTPTRADVLRATDRLIVEEKRQIDRLSQARDRTDQRGGSAKKQSEAIATRQKSLADLVKRRAELQAAQISRATLLQKMRTIARQRVRQAGPPTRER